VRAVVRPPRVDLLVVRRSLSGGHLTYAGLNAVPLVFALAACAATQQRPTLAIEHVNVIDVIGGVLVPDQTVVISGRQRMKPGQSLHDELALLADAGFSPSEVLRAATSNATQFLGISDSLGTVQRGMLADLVLLGGNPLTDIRNTQRIVAVIQNGGVIPTSNDRKDR
jgi:hypothetical protein